MEEPVGSVEISKSETSRKPGVNWLIVGGGIISGLIMLGVGFWIGKSVYEPVKSTILQTAEFPLPTSVVDLTINWRKYNITHDPVLELIDYEIKFPNDWQQQTHSSNFQETELFKAPDESGIRIIIYKNNFESLEDYLEELDKTSKTSWEGRPSIKVKSTKDISLGIEKVPALEREEEWLAAGFTTRVTYASIGNVVVSLAIIPGYGTGEFYNQIAGKVYDQVLSTIKINSPDKQRAVNYISPSTWKRSLDQGMGITLCLPPKWVQNGTTIEFDRDPGYKAIAMNIRNISYGGGSKREAYIKWMVKENYPEDSVRNQTSFIDLDINGNGVLLVRRPESGEFKRSLEVIWYAKNKLWVGDISSWSMVNDSENRFLEDVYTSISCSF